MICKRRPPLYDALIYQNGMEDGWYVLCDGCITWFRNEKDAKKFVDSRPVVEHNLLFPYIKNKDGITHSIHVGDYIVTEVATGDKEVYTPEDFNKYFKEVKK